MLSDSERVSRSALYLVPGYMLQLKERSEGSSKTKQIFSFRRCSFLRVRATFAGGLTGCERAVLSAEAACIPAPRPLSSGAGANARCLLPCIGFVY